MKVVDRKRLPVFGVDEALERILDPVREMPVEEIALAAVEGRYLAREIRASADMPPFDRTAMDGYAVRSGDITSVPVDLEVIEEILAGRDPAREVGPRQASRIMTGAAIPAGADTIVMVESTELLEGSGQVRILESVPPGRHIRRAGEDLARGAVMLGSGA